MGYESDSIIKVKKNNIIKIPEHLVKSYKIKEGDFFIVEKPEFNHILLKKAKLVEK